MEKLTAFKADWPEIKREALLALLVVVVGLVAVGTSHWLKGWTLARLSQAQASRQEAENTLANVESERNDLIASLPAYHELLKRSVIGKEDRLYWRELLDYSKAASGLQQLSYSLSAHKPLESADPGLPPESLFVRRRSEMKLSMRFKYETDMVGFLEDIGSRAPALTLVRNCRMSRAESEKAEAQPLLSAECQMDWVTLARQSPEAGGPAR